MKTEALRPFVRAAEKNADHGERGAGPRNTRRVGGGRSVIRSCKKRCRSAKARAKSRALHARHVCGIDDTSRRNFESSSTFVGGKREGSLLHHLDRCKTGMGSRLLGQWLSQPLRDAETITVRHGVVGHSRASCASAALGARLSRLYDLERLNGRLGAEQATPRDLGALRDTLACLPELATLLTGKGDARLPMHQSAWKSSRLRLAVLAMPARASPRRWSTRHPCRTKRAAFFAVVSMPAIDELVQFVGRRQRLSFAARSARARKNENQFAEDSIQSRLWLRHRNSQSADR